MQEMSDEELQAQTEKFKARYAEKEKSLDDLLQRLCRRYVRRQ